MNLIQARLAALSVILSLSCTAIAADTELSFVCADGFELAGTLTTPDEGEGPYPVVLFHSGSGPTDRDGNQGPMRTDLFPQLASALAGEGIASYRYDKRAMPKYAAHFPPMDEMAPFFALERFAADARLAIAMLRDRDDLDGERLAMAGHSEGALIALMVGAGENPPAAIASLAGPGRPIAVAMREQIVKQFDAAPAMREQGLADLDRALEAASKGEDFPADLPAWSRTLFNPTTRDLMRDYATIDPAEVVRDVEGPVLVLSGEHDAQMSAERDARPLAEAARSRGDGHPAELVIVPGASHNLKAVAGPAEPGFAGEVVGAAIDSFIEWCTKVLGPAEPGTD